METSVALGRDDGHTYIDEPRSPAPGSPAVQSGSSVSETDEDESSDSPVASPPIQDLSRRLSDFAVLDRDAAVTQESGESEDDYDIDDEDWEFADGDFTKQYNRMRQQHSAEQPKEVAAGPSRPLPARNQAAQSGVSANPKVSRERQSKDKSDRATQEQVLDSRTRLVLAGLVNRGIIGDLERCISTGKEANVYHTLEPSSRAIKIYRTAILSFRARQAYIQGEFRFRGEYSSSRNARKMVRVWAEKELRNLKRLEQYGIRAPRVLECKENVLVMDFLGDGDVAAPRLKDADIPATSWSRLYIELLVMIRKIYQHCKLVHGDLSEYNILYHQDRLYIIDVSQSVEHDHPKSFDFLRKDLSNARDFFAKRTQTLGLRRTWDFIVNEDIGIRSAEEVGPEGESLLSTIASAWIERDRDHDHDAADDAVFMASFIPHNLGEVFDPERDTDLLQSGQGDQLIYAGVTGLDSSTPAVAQDKEDLVPEADESSDDDVNRRDKSRGFRHEDKDSKKERKKAVKEENRERRQKKMPKAEKQRLIKKTAGRG